MKALLFVLCMIVSLALADGDWSQARLARFLCTNSRFYEPDYDEDEAEEPPSRERDRLPLFEDVIRESGLSANSICQGDGVATLWRPLFEMGMEIDYAWRTFCWNSESSEKAHVHVVIVGFRVNADGWQKALHYRSA